jgi:hypothetical protein
MKSIFSNKTLESCIYSSAKRSRRTAAATSTANHVAPTGGAAHSRSHCIDQPPQQRTYGVTACYSPGTRSVVVRSTGLKGSILEENSYYSAMPETHLFSLVHVPKDCYGAAASSLRQSLQRLRARPRVFAAGPAGVPVTSLAPLRLVALLASCQELARLTADWMQQQSR